MERRRGHGFRLRHRSCAARRHWYQL